MRHSASLVGLALIVALAVASPPTEAAMLGDAAVSYRAMRTVTIDGRTYSGPVFAEPGHQRHEQLLFGMEEVFLLDTRAARGELVLPSVRTFVEFPFPALMAELDAPDLLAHPVGRETVADLPTIKYRVDHRAADGSRAKGFLWLTRTRILMRLDVAVTRAHGGRPIPIAMSLSDVVLGPVDPALFEVPKGLARLPADALGPLLGGAPG